jgi:hypothetical protein
MAADGIGRERPARAIIDTVDRGRGRLAGLLALAAVIAGCGGGSQAASSKTTGQSRAGSRTAGASRAGSSTAAESGVGPGTAGKAGAGSKAPGATAGSTDRSAPAAAVAVIRDWSSELAQGNVAAASAYFGTPSVIQVDPTVPAVTLRTRAEVVAANRSLPCGARLLSARVVGRYIDSLFVLGNRPGGGPGGCGSGTGLTARVAFVISGGRIVQWRRIPDEPGDSAHDSPGAQAPPPASTGPGQPGVSVI